MSLLSSLKALLGGAAKPTSPSARATAPEPEPEPTIPEITAAELHAAWRSGAAPLILDCREPWERKQARIPGSLHIPMNDTPRRLAELPREREIVVVCAHGNRSYGVAGYLIQQGYRGASLRGGMAAWQAKGGEVESDARPRK